MQNDRPEPFKYLSKSAEATRRIGMQLGKMLQTGDIVCLQGDLGAGKTTFVQGVAQGWGTLDPVSSPTFILVNTYHRTNGNLMFHLDTYRLESVPEAEELDLESMLTEGLLLIEWPERLGPLISNERLWIEFAHMQDEQRQMKFMPSGQRYEKLMDELIPFINGVN